MHRRQVLKLGAGVLGLAAAAGGIGAYRYLPPSPSAVLRPPREIAGELLQALSTEARDRLLVAYDHPFRQYHNRGVWAGSDEVGINIWSEGLSWHQRSLVVDLMYSGLSAEGQQLIPNQMYLSYADAMANSLLICGEPTSEHCQILFTGPHLNLRIGGQNREGVAFGGPQVYGDQTGNGEPGLPDNVHRPQFATSSSLFQSLDSEQQSAALLEQSPIQTLIEVQGANGVFPGLPVADMSQSQQRLVKQIIDLAFAAYPQTDVDYGWECLNANGGIGALSASFYADSRYGDTGGYQNFRLEGPAAVFYFQGYPHVHGFFNVAMDGENPMSVGDVVGENPNVLDGVALGLLFERALLAQTGADLAYYDEGSAVGRIRQGTVRTGDIYTAESWENRVVEVVIKGKDIVGRLADRVAGSGERLDADRDYRVATIDYVADEHLDSVIGPARRVRDGGPLRHLVIDYVKANGFS